MQRVSREFVRALDRLVGRGAFPGLHATLLVPAGADAAPLGLSRIGAETLGGGAGYLWEQVVLPRRAGTTPLLCLGNTAPVWSLARGRQVGVIVHDQSYRLFLRDYSAAYRAAHAVMGHFILRSASPLVTVSETEAAQIARSNPGLARPILVAPNGCTDGDLAPIKGAARENFVLHVGGFSERKNGARAFAAVATLAGQGIATILVGTPNDAAERFLAGLDADRRRYVTFAGYVDDARLADLYARAACLLYPSLYEASGLPPTEAMAAGCPVVTTDLPVLRERCGDAALFVDPQDPAAMAAAVARVRADRALAADLSSRGLLRAATFTWENQARTVVQAMLDAG